MPTRPMTPRPDPLLYAVVGPSGAGKDSLMMAAKAARPDIVLVRRIITRPTEAGGEEFEGVTEAEFARRKAAGDFALSWSAHGLHYAIPASIHDDIAAGHPVLFNASRAMLAQAAQDFPDLVVLYITAPVAVLTQRLRARGRERLEDIAARLLRNTGELPAGLNIVEIENAQSFEKALAQFLSAIQPVSAAR